MSCICVVEISILSLSMFVLSIVVCNCSDSRIVLFFISIDHMKDENKFVLLLLRRVWRY
jgi:hypothetical protein